MVNAQNILKVADAIEKHSIPHLGFNMAQFVCEAAPSIIDHTGHGCGTVACIAGWTNVIGKGLTEHDTHLMSDESFAADFLGIEFMRDDYGDTVSDQLFYARSHPDYAEAGSFIWPQITADQAVRTLRHLAATGNVDWTV